MPDFHVYALHPFEPLNEDELSFKAGETILVLEKDDEFGDGWWLGKNTRTGAVGLFPQSYTAEGPSGNPDAPFSIPPSTTNGGTLTPLHEISEPSTTPPPASSNKDDESHVATDPGTPHSRLPSISLNSGGTPPTATMTDVQRAIESLGKRPGGASSFVSRDDDESFSFRSDVEGEDLDNDHSPGSNGEHWHKEARARLAEKARKAVEDAERLESMFAAPGADPPRIAPPITTLDMSDESDSEPEDDDEHTFSPQSPDPHRSDTDDELNDPDFTQHSHNRLNKHHSVIPEESEGEGPSHNVVQEDKPTTAPESAQQLDQDKRESISGSASTPTPAVAPESIVATSSDSTAVPIESPKPQDIPIPPSVPTSPAPVPPASPRHISTSASEIRREVEAQQIQQAPLTSSPLSITPSPTQPPAPAETPVTYEQKTHEAQSEPPPPPQIATSHPSTWTLDQVIDWVRVKGFGNEVVDKFIEQEITGDVLLDLDAPTLKSEIGIMAFGKRVRIANAITELRMPPPMTNAVIPPSNQIEPLTPAHSNFSSERHSARSLTIPSHKGGEHERQQSISLSSDGALEDHMKDKDRDSPLLPVPATKGKDGGGKGGMRRRLFGRSVDSREGKDGSDRDSGSGLGLSPTHQKELGLREDSTDGQLSPGISPPQLTSSMSAPVVSPYTPSPVGSHKKKHSISSDDAPSGSMTRGKKGKTTGVGLRDGASSLSGSSGKERLSLFASFGGHRGDKDKEGKESGKRKEVPRYSTSGALSESEQVEKDKGFSLGMLYTGRGGGSSQAERPGEIPIGERNTLRKRTSSYPVTGTKEGKGEKEIKAGGAVEKLYMEIGEPDYNGWMRKKGERYNTWKLRYFVLKGHHLYVLRSPEQKEAKIKSYINVQGYKVTADENLNPGKYAFRIEHDIQRTHYFSSDDKSVVRGWMKAIMKATIGRDYSKPVISSVNIPTIPLVVAQAMNPAPRPPSPTQRAATQRSFRRENPNQLSSRDARVLMGLPGSERDKLEIKDENGNFLQTPTTATGMSTPTVASSTAASLGVDTPIPTGVPPPRPTRRSSVKSVQQFQPNVVDTDLIAWANTHLPAALQIPTKDTGSPPTITGLHLLRIAESIKGRPSSPPVPDSAFPDPSDPSDERLDGLFRLFDFLLDNEVRMGSVSINDVRVGRWEKVVGLVGGLREWEKRRWILVQGLQGVGGGGPTVGGFVGVA